MALEVRRLSYSLGVEILGVDLRAEIDAATLADIRAALVENCVVLFRGQELTPEQQIAFSRRFGDLPHYPALAREIHPDYPEIWVLTNIAQADGQPSFTRDTGRVWHSDQSFMAEPALGSLLYCRECPEAGGTTMFTNMFRAYDALSEPFKQMLTPLRAVHNINVVEVYRARHPNRSKEAEGATPPVAQPVVRTHPESGRKALYVSEGITTHIEGLTPAESRAVLDFLNRHSTQPVFTYRHNWQVHDLIFWDNRSTMHYAPPDLDHGASNSRRLMHRTTVAGDAPY